MVLCCRVWRNNVHIYCHFRWFGSAALPYEVRSTIGLLRDNYASCFKFSRFSYFDLYLLEVSRYTTLRLY